MRNIIKFLSVVVFLFSTSLYSQVYKFSIVKLRNVTYLSIKQVKYELKNTDTEFYISTNDASYDACMLGTKNRVKIDGKLMFTEQSPFKIEGNWKIMITDIDKKVILDIRNNKITKRT